MCPRDGRRATAKGVSVAFVSERLGDGGDEFESRAKHNARPDTGRDKGAEDGRLAEQVHNVDAED